VSPLFFSEKKTMIEGSEFGTDFVKRAAADLVAVRPAYRAILDFYADIFIAQEEARSRVRIEPFRLPSDLLQVKLKEQFPLIQPKDMRLDAEVGQGLFSELCRIAIDRGAGLAESGSILVNYAGGLAPLFRGLLDGDEVRIKAAADVYGVKPEALSFFLHHSLRPSLCRCAQELSAFLPGDLVWEKGYCPICGSPPALGWLGADGQRFLFCSFCWHRWPGRRAVCPLCANSDPRKLSYLYSEEEKEYRLDVCEACRHYLKTVDGRNLSRLAYPPLEHIASLHLDLKAAEAGYTAGVSVHLPD
jgi:FdhE protein